MGLQTKVWSMPTTGVIDQVQATGISTAYLGSVRRVSAVGADLGQLLAPSFGTCHAEATLPLNTPGGYHAE